MNIFSLNETASEYNKCKSIWNMKAIAPLSSINQSIFVLEKCCVFLEAGTEFLNI
jgi:hypothetical protein